jgi:hypothetical protein
MELEIIATKNGKHYISYMSQIEWLEFLRTKKQKGFMYQAFQVGFSSFELENFNDKKNW